MLYNTGVRRVRQESQVQMFKKEHDWNVPSHVPRQCRIGDSPGTVTVSRFVTYTQVHHSTCALLQRKEITSGDIKSWQALSSCKNRRAITVAEGRHIEERSYWC